MNKGRLSIHATASDEDWPVTNEKWRLRSLENHPLDPGWERGEYSKCHSDMRERVAEGEVIFDVVKREGEKVIRSAFVVDSKDENVLEFEEFYFLDGSWKDGIHPEELGKPQTRWGVKVDKDKYFDLMNVSDFYNLYEAAKKPKSIDEKDWKRMVETAYEKINESDNSKRESC